MGCYQCGAPEGNEMKLCPACTKERVGKMRSDREAEARPKALHAEVDEAAEERRYQMKMYAQAGGAAVFIGVMAWLFLFSAYGPGWGLSQAEYAYKKCVQKVQSELDKSLEKQKAAASASGAAEKAMAGLGEALVRGMGTAVCEGLREKCKADPNGEACRGVMSHL